MARTNATNFSGALQFPYATAATDLFHKEDVQTLALAVDQHDHSSGKGLILATAAIPANSITSAMIVNGTITGADIATNTIVGSNIAPQTIVGGNLVDGTVGSQQITDGGVATVDLAANAVTQARFLTGTTANPTTTSATLVDLPEVTLTFTSGGTAAVSTQVLIWLSGSFYDSTVSAICTFGINIDSADVIIAPICAPGAGTGFIFIPTVIYLTTLAPGAHTIKGRWSTNAGTLTCNQAQRVMSILELRR
jgi:hypothetical protein